MSPSRRLQPYASLRNRNFRLFFAGQLVSSIGTWLHQIAESWLVLQITGSGFAVGVVIAARFIPVLSLGMWGGALADRHDRRRVLYVSQTLRAAAAGVLGVLAFTDEATAPVVIGLAFLSGVANAVDNPVRRAFIGNLVPDNLMLNAVSLNSSVMAASRVLGPLLAGLLIAWVGVAWCFTVNAVSYVAVLLALRAMRAESFRPTARSGTADRSIRAGLRYVRATPGLVIPLMMVGVVSALAWNWETLLALHATREFGGGARMYTAMFAVLSVGTLAGALSNTTRAGVTGPQLVPMTCVLAAAMVLTAVVPGIALTLVTLAVSGVAVAVFNTASNAVVQLAARGEYQGRVMALFSTLFAGSKGVGGALAGALAEGFGTRVAIAASGFGCLGAAGAASLWFRHVREPVAIGRTSP